MKKTLIILITLALSPLIAFSAVSNPAQEKTLNKSAYPRFSWDTVPIAAHFSKRREFTEAEAKFLGRYSIICLEKHQGTVAHKDARVGAAVASKLIKKHNPDVKVLFYWNACIDSGSNYFGHQILAEGQHPEWKLGGKDKDVLIRGEQETYDVGNPDLRKWWVDIAVNAVKDGDLDGVLIDALAHYWGNENQYTKILGEQKLLDTRKGLITMTNELGKALGKDKMAIFNNVNYGGRDFENDIAVNCDGGMMENFCNFKLKPTTKESALKQIESIQTAGKMGRIVMAKGWPRYSYRRAEEWTSVPKDELYKNVREDIIFPLACFLIGAGEYSYFMYSWGFGDKFGSLMEFDEFKKPLGAPKSDFVRKDWVFTRSFEHADVWLNLETKEAKIDWKN